MESKLYMNPAGSSGGFEILGKFEGLARLFQPCSREGTAPSGVCQV